MMTPSPISAAAMKPQSVDMNLTPRTKDSMQYPPATFFRASGRQAGVASGRHEGLLLFDAQRFVDKLLAVGYILGELRVRALFGDIDPGVVLGGCQRDDLNLVVLEHLDHFVVHALRFLREII